MAYTFKHGDRPLEGFAIQRAVGRGGFGEVYYALADSGKQVAIKYLRENPDVELRGIAQVMNLKSPHLITIYDVKHNSENEPFVVMEYVGGPSLRELLIAEPGGLGPQKAAFFVTNIAKGLSYLHERGIVHRDMKPGNIFYDDGYVKIGDYGLSKHISCSAHSGNTVSVGTVHYMAPEIGSGSYSKAIDIYAMGVMLYEMLTGRLPFTGSSMGEVLMRHMNDRPDMVGIPEPFRTVIIKSLAKDPQDRYQDADEMVEALVSAGGLSDSIASFDPLTLTHIPRMPHAHDQTMTSAPRAVPPPPPLDARAADLGIPPIPPIPGEPRRIRRLRRRAERLADRARKAGARLAGRARKADVRVKELPPSVRARMPHIITLLVVTVAVGIGLGFLSYGGTSSVEPAIPAIIFMLAGTTVGALLAHFLLIPRLWVQNTILERFAYAAGGLICMSLGIAIASEVRGEELMKAGIAMVAMLFIFDWSKRIGEGRKRIISGSSAIMPGILGLIIAWLTDADRPDALAFVFAGMCATASLLIPAAAAMWPYSGKVPPLGGPAAESDEALLRAAGRYDRAAPGAAPGEQAAPSTDQAKAETTAQSTPQYAAREPIVREEVAQPSFVGRAANAGLGFIGKLLLMTGIVWILAYNSTYTHVEEHMSVTVGGAGVHFAEAGHDPVDVAVPPFVVLVPFLIGTLLLMIARRSSGNWHFVRGLIGCGFAIGSAFMVLAGSAGELVPLVFAKDWSDLRNAPNVDPLVGLCFMLGISLVLMYWPPKLRKRTVVI